MVARPLSPRRWVPRGGGATFCCHAASLFLVMLVGCREQPESGAAPQNTTRQSGISPATKPVVPPRVLEAATGHAHVQELIAAGRIDAAPVRAVESPTGWNVWFGYRSTTKQVGGQTVVTAQDPAELHVAVHRDGFIARIVPNR